MRLSVSRLAISILIVCAISAGAAEPVDTSLAKHIYYLTWALVEAIITIDSLLIQVQKEDLSPATLMEIQAARERLYAIILVLKNN